MAQDSGKPKVKKAALLKWALVVADKADAACQALGVYVPRSQDPDANNRYMAVLNKLRGLADELENIAKDPEKFNPLSPQASYKAHCSGDDECPDDQICVHGSCQSTFP